MGVVIVAYASASTLGACLAALPIAALHGVVVVDNASPDDSAAIAAGVVGVQVVSETNRGFGAGCNAGVAALPGANLLLFLNPDAIITALDLLALVNYLDTHAHCALVGPRLFRAGEPLTSAGRMGGLRTEFRALAPTVLGSRLPERRLPVDYRQSGPVGYVEGACFLTRAQALTSIGGFDETFFLFFEEMDLARRFGLRGWTVDLLASARAEHLVAVSRAALSDGGQTHMLRSSVLHLHRQARWKAVAFAFAGRLSLGLRGRFGGLESGRAHAGSAAIRDGLRHARSPGSPR